MGIIYIYIYIYIHTHLFIQPLLDWNNRNNTVPLHQTLQPPPQVLCGNAVPWWASQPRLWWATFASTNRVHLLPNFGYSTCKYVMYMYT